MQGGPVIPSPRGLVVAGKWLLRLPAILALYFKRKGRL